MLVAYMCAYTHKNAFVVAAKKIYSDSFSNFTCVYACVPVCAYLHMCLSVFVFDVCFGEECLHICVCKMCMVLCACKGQRENKASSSVTSYLSWRWACNYLCSNSTRVTVAYGHACLLALVSRI